LPVFFFLNSTLTTPTAFPTQNALVSISISSYINNKKAVSQKGLKIKDISGCKKMLKRDPEKEENVSYF
jgi:hypothetical protein